MEHKKIVGKSKSSDIGTAPELTTANKKSWSSARFAYSHSKKRGVYVEKKATVAAVPSRAKPGPSDVPNIPRTSTVERRPDKNFITRCLNILSQETIATQYPEDEVPKSPVHNNTPAFTVDKGSQDLDAMYASTDNDSPQRSRLYPRRQPVPPPIKQRRPKFRSKALSENFSDLHVIQPQKSASQSPDVRSRMYSTNRSSKVKQERTALLSSNLVEDKTKSISDKDEKSEHSTESRKRKKVQIESTVPVEDEFKENPNKDGKKSQHSTVSKYRKILEIENDRARPKAAIYPENSDVILIKEDAKRLKTILKENSQPRSATPASEFDEVKSNATNDSERTLKVKKKMPTEKPSTHVGDHNSRNKSLYNLFVDLLETTFNVYNVESKYTNAPILTFEVEENASHKMKTTMSQNKAGVDKTVAPKQRVFFNYVEDVAEKVTVYDAQPNYRAWNPPPATTKRIPFRKNEYGIPRMSYERSYGNYNVPSKSQSFWNTQKRNTVVAAKPIRSLLPKKYAQHKQDKNQNLLNILKKELQMEDDYYEEPGDFHQALAKIAKEKKRTRKLICFAEDDGGGAVRSGKSECFKRRKVISGSTKSPKKKLRKTTFIDPLGDTFMPLEYAKSMYDDEPSCHSIEVMAFDYEPNQHLRRMDLTNKELIYTTISETSLGSDRKRHDDDDDENNNNDTDNDPVITASLKDLNIDYLKLLSGQSSETASTTISQLLLRDVYNMY
ncbi:hypothetical protein O0L34_g10583 [Tuta absoluta]|nr:hypothetical protein O0L34_g10583 [Tuta absoluta]